MVADDSLFLLIKSLSQAEKRYFKVFAGRHVIGEKNHYVDLFDAIERQVKRSLFDEKKLISFFKNRIAHFPSAKHYLFEIILKSLRAFHEGELIHQQVNDRINDIKLLMRRGLYKRSMKLLMVAKKMAESIDDPLIMLELLHLERRHAQLLKYKTTAIVYRTIQNKELECVRKVENDTTYRHIHDRCYILVQQQQIIQDKETKGLLNKADINKLLKQNKRALTFTSQWNNLLSRSNYAQLLRKPDKSKEEMKQLMSLFDSHPIMKREYASEYISILANYLHTCFHQGDFEEFPKVLTKIKKFKIESLEDEFIIFSYGTFLELPYLIVTNALEECIELVPFISSGLKKFQDKLTKDTEFVFLGNLSALYFLLERWEDGLDWVNKIILHTPENVRYDIQSAVRILQLIMHFELRNYDLVDYLLRTHKRYYLKNKRFFLFEKICLQFISDLIKSPVKTKDKNLLTVYYDQLLDFKKKNKEYLIGFNEVQSWVESHLQKKPIRALYYDILKKTTKGNA